MLLASTSSMHTEHTSSTVGPLIIELPRAKKGVSTGVFQALDNLLLDQKKF